MREQSISWVSGVRKAEMRVEGKEVMWGREVTGVDVMKVGVGRRRPRRGNKLGEGT